MERRYTQQIDQLTAELGVQWESTNRLQMELDKQRRENGDLRRELTQKQALLEEMKKDLQNKISKSFQKKLRKGTLGTVIRVNERSCIEN